MTQKITEEQLRQIIKEEILASDRLTESVPYLLSGPGRAAMTGGRIAREKRAAAAAEKERAEKERAKKERSGRAPATSVAGARAERNTSTSPWLGNRDVAANILRGFDSEDASEVAHAERTLDPAAFNSIMKKLEGIEDPELKAAALTWADSNLKSGELKKINKAMATIPKKIRPVVADIVNADTLKSMYDAGNERYEENKKSREAAEAAAKAAEAAAEAAKNKGFFAKVKSFLGLGEGADGAGPRITERQLRQIIKEEIKRAVLLREAEEVKDSETGRAR